MSTPKTDKHAFDCDIQNEGVAFSFDPAGHFIEASFARQLETEAGRLREALIKIHDFTTGYDDVAGIVCKIARAALEPK